MIARYLYEDVTSDDSPKIYRTVKLVFLFVTNNLRRSVCEFTNTFCYLFKKCPQRLHTSRKNKLFLSLRQVFDRFGRDNENVIANSVQLVSDTCPQILCFATFYLYSPSFLSNKPLPQADPKFKKLPSPLLY